MHREDCTSLEDAAKVNLFTLAEKTGFPLDLIKKELMLSGEGVEDIELTELRHLLLRYIDQTMIEEETDIKNN